MADVQSVVKQLALQYYAANLPLDRGGKSGSDLYAKSRIVVNAAKTIAAEAAELEDEPVNIFKPPLTTLNGESRWPTDSIWPIRGP